MARKFALLALLSVAFPACRLVSPPVDGSSDNVPVQSYKPRQSLSQIDADLLKVREAFENAQRGYRMPSAPSSSQDSTPPSARGKTTGASSAAAESATPAFSAGPFSCRWNQRSYLCKKSSEEWGSMPETFLCLSQQECMGPFLRYTPSDAHLVRPELDMLTAAVYSAR